MPTKKTVKKENSTFDFQKLLQNSDSYKSLIYGIVTVVVLFIVIALGVRTLSQNRAEIDDQAATIEESEGILTDNYIVSEGETLWSIAEKSYNNGYAWEEIARANDLKEPYALEEGQRLTIPKLSPTTAPTAMVSPTSSPMPTSAMSPKVEEVESVPSDQKIAGGNYKIVEGDNLWTIAVRAYGDGYRWVEIARDNNLANPDLIYPDDALKLPRP